MMTTFELTTKDRVQLLTDGEWHQVAEIRGTRFTVAAADLLTRGMTDIKGHMCNDGMSQCYTSRHCRECDGCPRRGGPYGCHCNCECTYCTGEEEDR